MVQITFAELTLLSGYLADLQQFIDGEKRDYKFYHRWQEQIATITEIAGRLDQYLSTKNTELAREIEYHKRVHGFQSDEFLIFESHIAYYRSGIDTYNRAVEFEMIKVGLMDKPVQEMTGLELRTLLLTTLQEHVERQKQ
jgi:hypothetical protein